MITKVELLTDGDVQAWDNYAMRHTRSLFNCSIQFRRFLLNLLGPHCVPFYLVAKDAGLIVGILPAFVCKGVAGPVLNSMPWFGSNPGVLADYDQIKEQLLKAFMDIAEWTKCISATFISPPYEQTDFYDRFFEGYGIQGIQTGDSRVSAITTFPEYKDDVQFYEALMKQIHPKTRNQVRVAMRSCTVWENTSSDEIKWLKDMHRQNMEQIGGPVKDREFDIITSTFEHEKEFKFYYATDPDDNIMAALLLKYFNQTVDYMTPAVDPKYRGRNPMHALICQAMMDAAEKGFKYWNWGGTTIPGQEGVLHFKSRFGADLNMYKYYTHVFKPISATKEFLAENYPYFYVLPYNQIEQIQNFKWEG